MEIERKWMVKGWPEEELPLLSQHAMRQGYLVVEPTVRIREEIEEGKESSYVLCLKTGHGIAREEIEMEIPEEKFREIERMIALPLIPKLRRTYALPNGLKLEVNHVDEGLPSEFWYAEIEYTSVEQARNWKAPTPALSEYLWDDVTDEEGQTMGAYWIRTRLQGS